MKCLDPLRAQELIGLVREVAANEPSTLAIAKQSSLFEQGLTAGRTVDIEITGPDLDHLLALGRSTFMKVREIMPEAQAIPKPSLDLSSPELHVSPKRVRSMEMGVSALDLGYSASAMVDGAYAGDYFRDGVKIDLTIISEKRFSNSTQSVATAPIATPTSDKPVPLDSLAFVHMEGGPEQINRRQRQRAITVQVSPPPGVAIEDAMQKIREEIVRPMQERGDLQSGRYQVNLSGTADKLESTWNALQWNFLLALLITYLLMAALFESWLYPFVVILSVPLGALGGVLGLWVLNLWILQPLDVLTMLGFVILIGTVVNNPILIVEQALLLIRTEGLTHQEAILRAVRSRIRPIFMTTMTTVFGLMPLVLFPGAGSELYRGLGAVVLGGLLFSTLVTLIVVPAVFSLTLETAKLLGVRVKHEQTIEPEVPTRKEPMEVPVG